MCKKLTNTPQIIDDNEKALSSRAIKRKRFLKKEWKYNDKWETYYLKYGSDYIYICRREMGYYEIVMNDECLSKYKGFLIKDLDLAKALAFDVYERNRISAKDRRRLKDEREIELQRL